MAPLRLQGMVRLARQLLPGLHIRPASAALRLPAGARWSWVARQAGPCGPRQPVGAGWCSPHQSLPPVSRVRRPVSCQAGGGLQAPAGQVEVEVGLLVEGDPLPDCRAAVEEVAQAVEGDAVLVVRQALALQAADQGAAPAPAGGGGAAELSLVLCDDATITRLNAQHLGKAYATDVLSFPMDAEGEEAGFVVPPELAGAAAGPPRMLGDCVISLDTAARQAAERGHSLLDEVRVLLVHGTLHLLGWDHERGPTEAAAQAAAEQRILEGLGWHGQGLIASNGGAMPGTDPQDDGAPEGMGSASQPQPAGKGSHAGAPQTSSTAAPAQPATPPRTEPAARGRRARRRKREHGIELVAIDMDGTLLDSASRVRPSSVAALRAALDSGLAVCLATGKARPAALAAMEQVGLAGPGGVVSTGGPGIFLQGLAVHGRQGDLLAGSALPHSVVEAAFTYAEQQGLALAGFLGDECVTLRMTPELQELHTRYYEPLAQVAPSLEAIVQGPPVKKLLFMSQPELVEAQLKPHWAAALAAPDSGAEVMQAVPNMLELVPRHMAGQGANKWEGMKVLLGHLGLPPSALMAIGDGSNDLTLVANAGLGVAMANAVPQVLAAAKVRVASNDEDGVAEAISQLL